MANKLVYFNPYIDENGYTFSIDKVSITFEIPFGNDKRLDCILSDFKDLIAQHNLLSKIVEDCPPRSSFAWTKHFIKFDAGIVAFLGSWQRHGDEWDSRYNCRLEFNPNKQLGITWYSSYQGYSNAGLIKEIIGVLRRYSNKATIKRLDYAIDVPIRIENIICPMSRRRMQNYGSTKYFGVPGSHGRLKIYDKQVESLLDSTLTRIEYTFKAQQKIKFENIMILEDYNRLEKTDLKNLSFNCTDIVLVKLCLALKSEGLDYSEYLKGLTYRKRKKVLLGVEGSGSEINQREDVLNYLVFGLIDYLGLDGFDNSLPEAPEMAPPDDWVLPSDEFEDLI